ncbi:polysaccharide deacetylase family protein [Alkalihalophilus sp. As8PL]|uniref:Polysaccharide deacetylase family protein n=2 Tax=Alkalihalophilus TaxID=2893060 RepID=A0AB39BYB0_9BACI
MYNSLNKKMITNGCSLSQREEKSVILTFDDGPSKYLEDFLDVLASEQIEAMFFFQTRLLHHKRPWNRLLEEGHVIGAHTHRHPNLSTLQAIDQRREIETSKHQIEKITGQTVKYFRPPFGQFNEETLNVLSDLQLEMVMWDVASFDWLFKGEALRIIDMVKKRVRNGSIVLLHELEQTLRILPLLIKELKEEGYSFKVL